MSQVLQPIPEVQVTGGTCPLPPAPGPGIGSGTGTLLEALQGWRRDGAHWVHVIDVDAANGAGSNLAAVRDAAHHVKGHLRIQYSGRVVDEVSLAAALQSGAERVVIEIGDVSDLDWAKAALDHHGQRVMAGLAVRGADLIDGAGHVVGDVWDTLLDLDAAGCPRFLICEAGHHGHWFHREEHVIAGVVETVRHPVLARGGVRHLEDLHTLAEMTPKGLEAAVIGGPLYDGGFTLQEALTATEARFDPYEWGPARP